MISTVDDLLPAILRQSRKRSRLMPVSCVLSIDGEDRRKLLIDFAVPSVQVKSDDCSADCRITLSEQDLSRVIGDPDGWAALYWSDRTRFEGVAEKIESAADALFPNRLGHGHYAALGRLVPDPRLVFMNHGFVDDPPETMQHELGDEDRPWRYQIALARHILAGVDTVGRRILEVGCGRGGTSSYAMRYLRPQSLLGIDACEASIQFCRRRHAIQNLDFAVGDACNLSVDSKAFDIVVNIESSHCYKDLGMFFSEISRVLAPGGYFCYTDGCLAPELQRIQQTLSQQEQFEIVRSRDITANVARAIALNRNPFRTLMLSMADEQLGNRRILSSVVDFVNRHAYQKYTSRKWLYRSWLIRKKGGPAK